MGDRVNLKKWLVIAGAATLALGLVGCGGSKGGNAQDAASGSLTVQGSDTMVNLAQAWSEKYTAENPGVSITVTGGGTGTGIASLINGTVDFANASREMKDEENQQSTDAGVDPVETEVAKDGIAVLLNPGNTVEELSLDQLGKIYRGEIENWKEVGGADAPIVLLGRDTSSGTYEYFKEAVVGKESEYAKSMKNLQSSQAIVEEVAKNPKAIGYVGIGYVNDKTKVARVDGVAASIDTVLDGSYVLSRGLYMYSNGQPEGAQKAYIDWILSDAGQAVVTDQGFVPLTK